MPVELLTLLKFILLALLYLFVGRTVRSTTAGITGLRGRRGDPGAPTPRPAVANPSGQSRRSRRVPRQIVVHDAGAAPRVVGLTGHGLVLGRGPTVQVPLGDIYVSDEHAEILPDDGSWSVRDLGSTNGTFLNGAKVTRPTPITAGDQLRLGKTTVEVRR